MTPKQRCMFVQLLNTITFFFSGAVCVNFVVRSTATLNEHGLAGSSLTVTLWRLPLIYVAVFLIRAVSITFFSRALALIGFAPLNWQVRP